MDASKLDPGLDGEVGKRVGQQRPQVLGTDEFPARRRGISPVHGCAGSQRADEGCHIAFLDPGPAQDSACSSGEDLGPVPLAACHRHQRSLAQRDCEIIGRVGFLPDADRILQGQVATIEVTAKDAREPLQKRGGWRHEAPRREPAYGLVGVGAHLSGPPPAQDGPEQGGPRLSGRVTGPGRIPVLPAINLKSQAMSIYRKLDASTRSQAVTRSREPGLLEGKRPVFHPIGGMELARARGGLVPDGEGSVWARQRDSRRLCGGSR